MTLRTPKFKIYVGNGRYKIGTDPAFWRVECYNRSDAEICCRAMNISQTENCPHSKIYPKFKGRGFYRCKICGGKLWVPMQPPIETIKEKHARS